MRIEKGLLCSAGAHIAQIFSPRTAALITDTTVAAQYAAPVEKSLVDAGFRVAIHAFPPGEGHKTLTTVEGILQFLSQNHVTRTDFVVALGGGIVGDVAGFAAAIYLRGLPFVQIPTTFLAAIDSSVGGKTGINLPAGKNLAGAFWQPSLVLCDETAFTTLPQEVFADGVAEAIKYGVIADAGLFSKLCNGALHTQMEAVIARCVEIKSEVVSEDEFDTGRRQLLNFGHTIGHAIERCSAYQISHGHAVSIGMAVAVRAALRAGFCGEDCVKEVERALESHHLPTQSPYTMDRLEQAMRMDKKRKGERITLILPKEIGTCFLYEMPVGELRALLEGAL